MAIGLAQETVERYVRAGQLLEAPPDLPLELATPGAVFVTLRIRGDLRGCVGTFAPSRPSLAHEIVVAAASAARHDPRFPPVRPDELASLEYEVSVIESVEPAASADDLDPKLYGVLVEVDGRHAGLLPGIAGVDTVAEQIAIAREKAGIPASCPVRLYRFEVRRYAEPC